MAYIASHYYFPTKNRFYAFGAGTGLSCKPNTGLNIAAISRCEVPIMIKMRRKSS